MVLSITCFESKHMNTFQKYFRAVSQAIQDANRDDLVLVVGSFFLAGEARKRWFPEELILEKWKIE